MRKIFALIFLFFLGSTALGEVDSSEWYRQVSISPDGKTILFSFKGDVYSIGTQGGVARPLTIHSSWDGHPVWSRDGKKIAFASDRHGNLDVFVMPSEGGKAKRLTFHSNDDVPSDFRPDDTSVIFRSSRCDSPTSNFFPIGRLPETYEVRVSGGTPTMISTVPASEVRINAEGNKIVYRDEKSYENEFRKHDSSSFARDIWLQDLSAGTHHQLTTFAGGDHNPCFVEDEVFFLSENGNGNFNVWRMNQDGSDKEKVTSFENHPVRYLSSSLEGTIAYSWHGSIFVQRIGKEPKKVEVSIQNDVQSSTYQNLELTKVDEFAVSPNGKELAFISRGEVYVTSRDFATTVRVTNTPQQERSVSFHPNGRTLLFAGERNEKWRLFETSIADPREKYFFASTKREEKEIYAAATDSFQPVYSPDGSKIAFLGGRDEIQVLNRETGDTHVALKRQFNYSYNDGDISFCWSSDGKWIASDYSPRARLFVTDVGVFPADGSRQPVDLSHSGYADAAPVWNRDANVVIWNSARFGQRDHGCWGREFDVMASFLDQASFDLFKLNREQMELQKEEDSEDEDITSSRDLLSDLISPDDRTVRLTKTSADITQAYLTKDLSNLYFLKNDANGLSRFTPTTSPSELWKLDLRSGEQKLVKQLGMSASFQVSSDEQLLFVLSDGKLSYSELSSVGSFKPIAFRAFMEHQADVERAYMFEHAWRQIKDKFYRKDLHGVDWNEMKAAYEPKLSSIEYNRDLAELMAELTGELNASHIGVYFRPKPMTGGDATTSLGVLFDFENFEDGLEIVEILDKSPLQNSTSSVEAGMKLVAINGVDIDLSTNLYDCLNNKANQRIRLSVERKDGTRFDQVVVPISLAQESELLYERWVKQRSNFAEVNSKGRIGYVHVRLMNDPSFRKVYSDLLGKHFDKEAVVVDTRWNGGGWLHNDLAKLFSGKEYMTMHVRGRTYRGDSMDQWNKPSILLMNEGNYSDAHAFPYTYEALNLGETVGVEVPGTMTAVWWETSLSGDLRVGVPQVGIKNLSGEYLENNPTRPDHLVKNDPQSTATGKDNQLTKAVEILLNSLEEQEGQK